MEAVQWPTLAPPPPIPPLLLCLLPCSSFDQTANSIKVMAFSMACGYKALEECAE